MSKIDKAQRLASRADALMQRKNLPSARAMPLAQAFASFNNAQTNAQTPAVDASLNVEKENPSAYCFSPVPAFVALSSVFAMPRAVALEPEGIAPIAPFTPATPAAADPEPLTFFTDDDLPTLTEVVSTEIVRAEASLLSAHELPEADLAVLIAQAIQQQMSYELPSLIEAALLSAHEELQTGIQATIKMAVRDFLSQRQQLNLPFESASIPMSPSKKS